MGSPWPPWWRACPAHSLAVHQQIVGMYGNAGGLLEEDTAQPRDRLARSCAMAESRCCLSCRAPAAACANLRLAALYGPGGSCQERFRIARVAAAQGNGAAAPAGHRDDVGGPGLWRWRPASMGCSPWWMTRDQRARPDRSDLCRAPDSKPR